MSEKQRNENDDARKYDGDKLRFDLIPPEALEALAAVYTMGAGKYDDRNWEKGLSWSRVFAAVQRHLWSFWKGEDEDPESGLLHLAHAAWGCFALIHHSLLRRNKDDRPVKVTEREHDRLLKKRLEGLGFYGPAKNHGKTAALQEEADTLGVGLGYHIAAKYNPGYFWLGKFDPRADARLVYISHPFASNPDQNKEAVGNIAWKISNWHPPGGRGFYVPVVPHTAIGAWLSDDERDLAMLLCLALVSICREFWLCGPRLSEGMAIELMAAAWWDIPVYTHEANFEEEDRLGADLIHDDARRVRGHGHRKLEW